MKPMNHTERTSIIVVEVARRSTSLTTGTMVDSISEVLNIREEKIEHTPAFGAKLDTDLYPWHGQDGRRRKDPPRYRSGLGA